MSLGDYKIIIIFVKISGCDRSFKYLFDYENK